MRGTKRKYDIILNVYDLHDNESLYPLGLGLYHTGVVIDGKEYTFAAGSGIFFHSPKGAPNARFRQSMHMGMYEGSESSLQSSINDLRVEFHGDSYHVLSRNCNCFSDALVTKLLNRPIPGWINRLAAIGSYCSCLLPKNMTGGGDGGDNTNNNPNQDSAYDPLVSHQDRNQAKTIKPFAGKGYRLGSN